MKRLFALVIGFSILVLAFHKSYAVSQVDVIYQQSTGNVNLWGSSDIVFAGGSSSDWTAMGASHSYTGTSPITTVASNVVVENTAFEHMMSGGICTWVVRGSQQVANASGLASVTSFNGPSGVGTVSCEHAYMSGSYHAFETYGRSGSSYECSHAAWCY